MCNRIQSKKNAMAWSYALKHFPEVCRIKCPCRSEVHEQKVKKLNLSKLREVFSQYSFLLSIHVPATMLSVGFRFWSYRFKVWISLHGWELVTLYNKGTDKYPFLHQRLDLYMNKCDSDTVESRAGGYGKEWGEGSCEVRHIN